MAPIGASQARAKELKAKAKRAEEASSAGAAEATPWEETVKGIEEKFWESVGGKAEDAAEAE